MDNDKKNHEILLKDIEEFLNKGNQKEIITLHNYFRLLENTLDKDKIDIINELDKIKQKYNDIKISDDYMFLDLIKELKNNIVINNTLSQFYNILLIYEIFADTLILHFVKKYPKDIEYIYKLSNINENIIEKIENMRKKFTLLYKYNCLERIEKKYKIGKDYNDFMKIIMVMNELRNRIFFHRNNYDSMGCVFNSFGKNINTELYKKEIENIKELVNKLPDIYFDKKKLEESLQNALNIMDENENDNDRLSWEPYRDYLNNLYVNFAKESICFLSNAELIVKIDYSKILK